MTAVPKYFHMIQRNMATEEEQVYIVDYTIERNRIFVSRQILWAFNHNCGVQLEPISVEEARKIKPTHKAN